METQELPLGRGIDTTTGIELVAPGCVRRVNVPKRCAKFYSLADARSYIGTMETGLEVCGLTKGQFSFADLIECVIADCGRVELDLSTWTAGEADIFKLLHLIEDGEITRFRMICDDIFLKHQPTAAREVLRLGGKMRILKTHSKFAVIRSDKFRIVIRTSMNLNANPRIEWFELSEGEHLFEFFRAHIDDVFTKQEGMRVTMRDLTARDDVENPLALL